MGGGGVFCCHLPSDSGKEICTGASSGLEKATPHLVSIEISELPLAPFGSPGLFTCPAACAVSSEKKVTPSCLPFMPPGWTTAVSQLPPAFPEKRQELEGWSTERVLTGLCTHFLFHVLDTDTGGVVPGSAASPPGVSSCERPQSAAVCLGCREQRLLVLLPSPQTRTSSSAAQRSRVSERRPKRVSSQTLILSNAGSLSLQKQAQGQTARAWGPVPAGP